jgi:heme-degrading monooxygenase HmoA
MVMTILDGRVSKENWITLEQAYKEASQANEPGLVESFLIHNLRETDRWQIVSVWVNREALDAMRQASETPRGVLIFRHAHTEPLLSIFDVAHQISQIVQAFRV